MILCEILLLRLTIAQKNHLYYLFDLRKIESFFFGTLVNEGACTEFDAIIKPEKINKICHYKTKC